MLTAIADECRRQVLTYASRFGYFTPSSFSTRVAGFKALTDPEQFRALTMLARMEGVATMVVCGKWRFYREDHAPAGALRGSDVHRPEPRECALQRAISAA